MSTIKKFAELLKQIEDANYDAKQDIVVLIKEQQGTLDTVEERIREYQETFETQEMGKPEKVKYGNLLKYRMTLITGINYLEGVLQEEEEISYE